MALALTGIGHRDVRRGDVICDRESELRATYVMTASLALDPGTTALERGARVQVHHGTRETAARLSPLEGERVEPGTRAVCRLKLQSPFIACPGDRLVVRQIAPPNTVGGGEILDPAPRKPRAAPRPAEGALPPPGPPPLGGAEAHLAELLRLDGERPRADGELELAADLDTPAATRARRALERGGLAVRTGRNLHFHREPFDRLVEQVVAISRREGRPSLPFATSWARAAATHRPCSSTSTRSS